MPTINDLINSEIDAINNYEAFIKENHRELTAKDIKRIKVIIKDEKDHLRIDKEIKMEHKK